MLFYHIAVLPLLVTSAFAVTYADVLNDLRQTDTDTKALTNAVNSYTGTGAQSLALRNASNKVQADIGKATNDTNASPVPSVADGTTVYNFINGQLFTTSQTGQNAVVNKRTAFRSAGILSIVCSDTRNTRSAVTTLANALIAKAPNQDLRTKGAATRTKYDNLFAATIQNLGCT